MKGTLLLLLILLGLSHFVCLEAVPVTILDLAGVNIHNHKVMIGMKWELVEARIAERMDMELHDYPPSGANGRHTPKPPYP
ncbi:hypothetical protein PHAVU_009G186700 [Phaseolus vulgaris]